METKIFDTGVMETVDLFGETLRLKAEACNRYQLVWVGPTIILELIRGVYDDTEARWELRIDGIDAAHITYGHETVWDAADQLADMLMEEIEDRAQIVHRLLSVLSPGMKEGMADTVELFGETLHFDPEKSRSHTSVWLGPTIELCLYRSAYDGEARWSLHVDGIDEVHKTSGHATVAEAALHLAAALMAEIEDRAQIVRQLLPWLSSELRGGEV